MGRVEVIMGPMFAGKTTALLSRVREEQALGRTVLLLKSAKDTRYASDHIVTHTGERQACHAVPSLLDYRAQGHREYAAAHTVAVDEAQFFADLREFVEAAAEVDGKTVVLAGLDGDYKRDRFGQVLDVIPLADRVTKLRGKCQFCSNDALFTLRVVANTQQELIGGSDKYVPTCRDHFHGFKPQPQQ